MVRHLEHVDPGKRTAGKERLPHPLLRVSGQQRGKARALHVDDHARVVGRKRPVGTFGPHHPQLAPPYGESISRLERHDVLERVGHAGEPHNVLPNRCERLRVVHDRSVDAFDPRDPDDSRDTAGMVGMVVREHDTIELAHPRPSERGSQHLGVGTGIHQQRVSAVPHENRIALPDVEHHERCSPSRRESDRSHQKGCQHGQADGACAATRTRSGPPCPHTRRAEKGHQAQCGPGGLDAECGPRKHREVSRDRCDAGQNECSERERDRSHPGGDDAERCADKAHGQRERDQRQGKDVGDRRDERHHPEERDRHRQRRSLGNEGERHRRGEQAGRTAERALRPGGRERSEHEDPRDRGNG